jgi:hypothetical protein
MSADVLRDLRAYKIPALGQAGLKVSDPEIVLASRSGFSDGLQEMAAAEPTVHLLHGDDVLASSASGAEAAV